MGLFGALFAGVSGLDSQSNKIGIISNNISNVNTVGYKQGAADFDTLVVPSGTTTFSPGGVIGNNQQLINQQGLISATTSSTDVAITGNGFVVVSSTAAGVNSGGTELYTRAGSFTQDSSGNFVNADGLYLQGLPIGADGTAGQPNTSKLVTVAVNQSATGAATQTSSITLDANLDASQTVLPGSSITATMQTEFGTSSANSLPTGNQILIGNDVPTTTGTAGSNLIRGATLNIVSTDSTTGNADPADVFTYGGFTIGRDVTQTAYTSAANTALTTDGGLGDNGQTLNTDTLAAGDMKTAAAGSGVVTLTVGNALDYMSPTNATHPGTGDGNISISGFTGTLDGIPAADLNGEFAVTYVSATQIQITANNGVTATTGGVSNTVAATAVNRTAAFSGNILNATSPNTDFLASGTGTAPNTVADFTSEAAHFDISVAGNTPFTFTYSPTPDPSSGTFNNLTTLAQAISDQSGLTATVGNNGRLYVSSTDANNSLTFTNGDAVGNGTLPGIDWVQELGLANQPGTGTSTTHYFNSLSGLAASINQVDPTNLTATVTNPTSQATLSITEANPEQTVTFSDGTTTNSSILTELGVQNVTAIASTGKQTTTGVLGKTYDALNPLLNMSSGAVTPQFTHDITVYDAQGQSHTVALNFVKLATNEWAVEATAVPATDVSTPNNDGLLGNGIIKFNGNGTIASDTLPTLTADWKNGAAASNISVDFGLDETGTSSGSAQVTQSAGASTMQATQNGAPTGELTGVSIDQNGFVIAAFSNGQTQKLYQIPLAVVNNPDGLEAVSGNAYEQTLSSGEPTLDFADQGGAGQFTPSALEQSNVDLSTQLTDLIVAQQAYGANSKVLTVADSLLQELDQIIQ